LCGLRASRVSWLCVLSLLATAGLTFYREVFGNVKADPHQSGLATKMLVMCSPSSVASLALTIALDHISLRSSSSIATAFMWTLCNFRINYVLYPPELKAGQHSEKRRPSNY
jgi:hypothetical protein